MSAPTIEQQIAALNALVDSRARLGNSRDTVDACNAIDRATVQVATGLAINCTTYVVIEGQNSIEKGGKIGLKKGTTEGEPPPIC